MLRFHVFLSGPHLICIATNGIDFSVMYDETVRMCSFPAGISVCTESGMYNCNCRFIIRVLQIFKEHPELFYKEHSFVHDGSA